MMRFWRPIVLVAAAAFMCGCHGIPDPYRRVGNPHGQNPLGTPADRTGGSRNAPDDGAGGGPGVNSWPADS